MQRRNISNKSSINKNFKQRDINNPVVKLKRLEKNLHESERHFRMMFEQAAVGLSHVGLDGRWLQINQKLCDIVGYTREELLKCTFQDITYPEDLEIDLRYVDSLLANEIKTYTMEKRYIRKDGSLVWINLTVSLVRATSGKPQYFISVVEDINQRKQIEEERAQLLMNEEAARIYLQTINEQLERANKIQNDFISIASHEFRTTLAGIQGFSELIRDRELSMEQIKDFAIDIHTDARRLDRMINDLLDIERMKSGRMTLHIEQIDLNAIIQDTIERSRTATQKHTFHLQLDETIPILSGDHDKLTQVMFNLISNAIKYSPHGGDITVRSEYAEDLIHVSVQDQGVGIPENALERIFQPYNRVDSAATRYIKGTGLGLPIVRQIIQMHEGKTWAESIPDQGSIVHFTLPYINEKVQ